MRLYLGGKMAEVVGYGFQAFDDAALLLRMLGHDVFNPAEHDRNNGFNPAPDEVGTYETLANIGFDRRAALKADLTWIMNHSEGMVAMDNWVNSSGTKAEITAHHSIGLPVWELNDFLKFGTEAPAIRPLVPASRVYG